MVTTHFLRQTDMATEQKDVFVRVCVCVFTFVVFLFLFFFIERVLLHLILERFLRTLWLTGHTKLQQQFEF